MANATPQAQLLTLHLGLQAQTASPEERVLIERLMVCVQELDRAAVAGGQFAALTRAATTGASVSAPKLVHEPRGGDPASRHFFFSNEGRRLPDEDEATRKAKAKASIWGFRNGQHEAAGGAAGSYR